MIYIKDHIAMIRSGRKTQTRREGKCRWKPGSVHPVKAGWYDKPAAWIRILDVRHERLGSITAEDARREGYSSVNSYKSAWEHIYKKRWHDDLPVWVIDFELVDGAAERPNQRTFEFAEGHPAAGATHKEGD